MGNLAVTSRPISCIVLVVLLAGLVTRPARAGDEWLQFRGPQRNGISASKGLLASWPATGPRLLWTFDQCGTGYAGITVTNDMIVTAGTFEDGTKVIALDHDGKLLWRAANGTGRWRVAPDKKDWATTFGGVRSTPTIANGLVFHLDVLGRLAAFKLATGQEVWSMMLDEAFKGVRNEWGYSESVLVENNRLYCLPGGKPGFLMCLEADTGKTVWSCGEIPDTQASNSSPIAVDIDGVRQIITMTTVLITGVDATTGKLLWQTRHENRFKENCETPQYVDGLLYVSSGYGYGSEGYRVSKAENATWTVTKSWHLDQADDLHGGPIILDGCVYGAGYDRKGAFCVDLQTGKFKWREPSIGRSSYTWADGLLYRLGEDGTMALERPRPEKYECVSSFRIPSARKSISVTHPVVCGKRLYVRHQERLYCYDVAAEK